MLATSSNITSTCRKKIQYTKVFCKVRDITSTAKSTDEIRFFFRIRWLWKLLYFYWIKGFWNKKSNVLGTAKLLIKSYFKFISNCSWSSSTNCECCLEAILVLNTDTSNGHFETFFCFLLAAFVERIHWDEWMFRVPNFWLFDRSSFWNNQIVDWRVLSSTRMRGHSGSVNKKDLWLKTISSGNVLNKKCEKFLVNVRITLFSTKLAHKNIYRAKSEGGSYCLPHADYDHFVKPFIF